VTRPSKQQIASVKAALREINAELLGWDPHVLVLLNDQAQKTQIIARMNQLGWHYVDDPSNETDNVSMVEFSLDATSPGAASPRHQNTRRVKFPAPFFASFGVICVIAAGIIAITVFYTHYRMTSLERRGTLTSGEIVSGRRDRDIQYVSYRFMDIQGHFHENEDAYPFDGWNALHRGDQISVTYLADNPERNNLTQRIRLITNRNPRDEMTSPVIFMALAGCFFFGYWVRKRIT
jgi:hypothetical protein